MGFWRYGELICCEHLEEDDRSLVLVANAVQANKDPHDVFDWCSVLMVLAREF